MKPMILAAMPLPPALTARLAEHYFVHGPLDRPAADAIPETARDARALITLGGMRHDVALSRSAQGTQQSILLETLADFFAGRPLAYRAPPLT